MVRHLLGSNFQSCGRKCPMREHDSSKATVGNRLRLNGITIGDNSISFPFFVTKACSVSLSSSCLPLSFPSTKHNPQPTVSPLPNFSRKCPTQCSLPLRYFPPSSP